VQTEEAVIDTNVLISANGVAGDSIARSCTLECVRYLRAVQETGRLHLDSRGLILTEYRANCNAGQPGVGNQFFLWAHRNQANREHVCLTTVTPSAERGFMEFPASSQLNSFDPADRKFVATALGCPDLPVLASAADAGWLNHQAALEAEGAQLRLLCAETRKPAAS
jgi:hypothetical protein